MENFNLMVLSPQGYNYKHYLYHVIEHCLSKSQDKAINVYYPAGDIEAEPVLSYVFKKLAHCEKMVITMIPQGENPETVDGVIVIGDYTNYVTPQVAHEVKGIHDSEPEKFRHFPLMPEPLIQENPVGSIMDWENGYNAFTFHDILAHRPMSFKKLVSLLRYYYDDTSLSYFKGTRGCSQSPFGTCIYEADDYYADYCVMCHLPHERK